MRPRCGRRRLAWQTQPKRCFQDEKPAGEVPRAKRLLTGTSIAAGPADLAAAEIYAHRTLPTGVVVGQEAASRGVGVRRSSATIADELQLADGNVPILRSDEQGPQFRTRHPDQLAVDVLFQTLDADLLADELASALVP